MNKNSSQSGDLPIVAITMGDPAGVGPELCLRALREPSVLSECVPVVFGDSGVMERVANQCALPPPDQVLTLAEWSAEPHPLKPAIVDCAAIHAQDVEPGVIAEACGRAAYTYIESAIQAALRGEVAAITTAPIHKEALHRAGVPFPGHTEIFAALSGADRACMMLSSDEITTSFVTTHIGVVDISASLSEARVLEVIELTADAMQRLRGGPAKIAVCGLNPHAGEHGLFGAQEEERFIIPAITTARGRGIDVEGPLPPDAAFVTNKRRQVDAYVCMYHDQGHIPFKMLAFDTGVNITLGLSIIRTSVDHGTAFDIAWKGIANPTSLYQATLWAARLSSGTTVSGT